MKWNDVLTFLCCVDVADKKSMADQDDIERSGNSIFLGFEGLESETALETEEMTSAAEESEPSVTSLKSDQSVPAVESDQGPSIKLLWTFQCPMTKGYNVTSIDWNKTNRVSIYLFNIKSYTKYKNALYPVSAIYCYSNTIWWLWGDTLWIFVVAATSCGSYSRSSDPCHLMPWCWSRRSFHITWITATHFLRHMDWWPCCSLSRVCCMSCVGHSTVRPYEWQCYTSCTCFHFGSG